MGQERPMSRWAAVSHVLKFVRLKPWVVLHGISRRRLRKLGAVLLGRNSPAVQSWLRDRLPLRPPSDDQPRLLSMPDVGEDVELDFPVVSQPEVSIIVPVYNQYATTVSCLRSVLAHTDGSYEVIVADDCSDDLTETITQRVTGIVHVKAGKRLGFLGNCNHAAARARGFYLVFLNNDTNVQPGWLVALLRVFKECQDAGVVGPKLLFDDRRLQAAGGIVWRDGSCWSFGRGRDPQAPEYNYLRSTDYVSGACLATPASVWKEIGGFDTTFAPAYYEDADYCFSARERRYRVLFQPESVVVHIEGVSHGLDLNRGVKKYQLINERRFRRKWAGTLNDEHFDDGEHLFLARDRSRDRTTVLVVDHHVPRRDQDADSRSTYLHLRHMTRMGMNVKFLGADFFPHQPYTRALQNLGIEVLVGPTFEQRWRDWLHRNSRYLDVIYLHQPDIAEQFLPEVHQLDPRPKLIYVGHDLHYLRISREAEIEKSERLAAEAEKWKRREFGVFEQVDRVYFTSQTEVDVIRRDLPKLNLRAIPLYPLVDPKSIDTYQHDARQNILFVGGFNHRPNQDAMRWFCRDVMPRLRAEISDVRLHIVGSETPPKIWALQSDAVVVHGFLSDDDLAELYGSVRVVVLPLRFGAGTKGKLLEALNNAVPLVTTSIGAEGLPEAGTVMRIADTAEEFATAVLDVYRVPAVATCYLRHYRTYIETYFSEQAVTACLEEDFDPSATTAVPRLQST